MNLQINNMAFLDFRGLDFSGFRFTVVFNSILFSSLLVLHTKSPRFTWFLCLQFFCLHINSVNRGMPVLSCTVQ